MPNTKRPDTDYTLYTDNLTVDVTRVETAEKVFNVNPHAERYAKVVPYGIRIGMTKGNVILNVCKDEETQSKIFNELNKIRKEWTEELGRRIKRSVTKTKYTCKYELPVHNDWYEHTVAITDLLNMGYVLVGNTTISNVEVDGKVIDRYHTSLVKKTPIDN